MKEFKAFTLAETLITIAIVGVVAALTIPTLITNYQKQQTVAKLKESYAILQNAVRLAEADYDSVSGWEVQAKNQIENIDKYLLPYLKATRSTLRSMTSPETSYKQLTGEPSDALAIIYRNWGKHALITLPNGAELITGNFPGSSLNEIHFLLDINGYNNGPNMLGKDTFYLQIVPAIGGLTFNRKRDSEAWDVVRTREQLINGPSSANEIYECNKKARGMWCGELIRRDGWKISKDYPW